MTPRILLAATSCWTGTARLAKALAGAGCEIEAVCPRGHLAIRTRAVSRIHRYHFLAPLRSIDAAIDAARPDLIIPCDDLTTSHMLRLHECAGGGDALAEARRGLIERSLGEPSSLMVATARSRLIAFAQERGIRVPATTVAHTSEGLTEWLVKHGCPAVLKTDGSFGGRGVRIVHSVAEAHRGWRALGSPPPPARAIKRAIVNRDMNYVLPCVRRIRPVVNVQAFVRGQDANCTVACWRGEILASITASVLETVGPRGPASVVRLIEHREIAAAVEHLVKPLKLSGLIGVDFVLEEGTGDAYLVEMNARAPQMAHLQLGMHRDLVGSLRAVLSGEPLRRTVCTTESELIALFPQEWLRDPKSEFLRTAYHDVPWDEPDLLRACLEETIVNRAWCGLSRRLHEATARVAGTWRKAYG